MEKKENPGTGLVPRPRWLPRKRLEKAVLQLPGEQTPFDSYQRKKLIGLLDFSRFVRGRSVLEVGCGTGDLLLEANQYGPRELFGIDSNPEWIAMARQNLQGTGADLVVGSSTELPFPEKSFDVVIVMYELQHLSGEDQVRAVVNEAARVSRQWVVLVEETAPAAYEHEHIFRRPVPYYAGLFDHAATGRFLLRQADYLHISVSRYVWTGKGNRWHWIRWLFSPLLYLMGFPSAWLKPPSPGSGSPKSGFALFLQQCSLPFTRGLDTLIGSNQGTTVMWFERERLFRRG